MKQKKKLLIMLAVLGALIIVTVAVKLIQQHQDTISKTAAIVVEKDEEDLTSIKMTVGYSSLQLEKEDDIWYYSNDHTYPVDQETVSDLLSNFKEIKASFMISDVTNYSQYGLKSPCAVIELTDTDGNVMTVNLGDYSTMDSQRYLENGDGNVYLIEKDLYEVLVIDIDEFFKPDAFTKYDTLQHMVVSGDNNMEIIYTQDQEYGYSTQYDYFLITGNDYLPLSQTKVKSLVSSLTSMDLNDYSSYYCADDKFSIYNLDNPDAVVRFSYLSGKETSTQTFYISLKNNKGYLRFEDSNVVYNLDGDIAESFIHLAYNDLRATEVCYLDYKQVDSITFTLADEAYHLTCKKGELYYNDEKLEDSTLTDAIDGLTISEFSEDDSDKKEELRFVIEQQNENAPTVTVVLKQLDGQYCLAVVNNKIIGKVERDAVITLKEALNTIILN